MTVDRGTGACPKRDDGLGHVWAAWYDDARKPCMFCGIPGRDNVAAGDTGGFFARATMARTNLFDTLATPKSAFGKAPSR